MWPRLEAEGPGILRQRIILNERMSLPSGLPLLLTPANPPDRKTRYGPLRFP
jgi:hypothetical protein